MTSEQLGNWRGDFGNDYVDRNLPTAKVMASRLKMWSRILESFGSDTPRSILEVGCNVGLNLRALSALSSAELFGLEPNGKARAKLVGDKVVPESHVKEGFSTLLPFEDASADMVFTVGVLIHIPPAELPETYREMHRVSRRFILSVEYYSEQPVTVPYRNKDEHLFKRDFGGMWLEMFPDLKIRDYGFFWRPVTGLDNSNWWLLEKPQK